MKILIIHEVDWRKKVVFEPHCLSEYFVKLGNQVSVIDYQSMWTGSEVFETPIVEAQSRVLKDVSVFLYSTPFIPKPLFSRTSAFLFSYGWIDGIIKLNKPDVILLYSVPTNGLQAILCAKKHKIPIYFRSIDVLNKLVPYKVLDKVTLGLEHIVYRSCDGIIALTENMAEYCKKMGAKNIYIVPEGVDTNLFKPLKSQMRDKLGIGHNDFVILFMGTLFKFCGLESTIKNFSKLLDIVPEAKLVIVGGGRYENDLIKKTPLEYLGSKIIFTGFRPYSELPEYINMADVCINPFDTVEETKDIFPAKILQYLACGKESVVSPLNGIKSMLGSVEGLHFSENGNLPSMLCGVKENRNPNQIGIADYIKENYSYEKIAQEFITIFQS